MAIFGTFHEFRRYLGDGTIDLDSHSFKGALTNTAPDLAADDEFADIVEIAAVGTYPAGGYTLASVTWQETGAGTGVWRWTFADLVVLASGAAIGPFRYFVVYDDTSTGDKLVGRLDIGTNITVADGTAFIFDIGADGVIELSE